METLIPPAISVAVALCIISSAAAVDMLRPSQPFHPTPSIPPINGTGPVQLTGGVWLSPWQTALACIVAVVGFIILGVTACLVAHCVKTITSRSGRVEPTTGHQILMVRPAPLHLGTSSMTLAKFATMIYVGEPTAVAGEDRTNDPEAGGGGGVPSGFAVMEVDHDAELMSTSPLAGSTAMECIFCQNGYEVGDKVLQLPCGHIFHKEDGIVPWLKKNGYCPICHACYSG